MTDDLTLKERIFDLTLEDRAPMNPTTPSIREIIESPIEIGNREIVPYLLTIPPSWGNISNPTIFGDFDVSATTQGVRAILFTIDALNNMEAGKDYRFEICFDIQCGHTLEAWGIWRCKD